MQRKRATDAATSAVGSRVPYHQSVHYHTNY